MREWKIRVASREVTSLGETEHEKLLEQQSPCDFIYLAFASKKKPDQALPGNYKQVRLQTQTQQLLLQKLRALRDGGDERGVKLSGRDCMLHEALCVLLEWKNASHNFLGTFGSMRNDCLKVLSTRAVSFLAYQQLFHVTWLTPGIWCEMPVTKKPCV